MNNKDRNNTNNNNEIAKFLNLLKKESDTKLPGEDLLSETLKKISVTNQDFRRNNIVDNFYWKVVNNLSIKNFMNIPWKLIAPVGLISLLLIVLAVNRYEGKDLGKVTNPINDIEKVTTLDKPSNSIDSTVDEILGYKGDSSISASENDVSDAVLIDAEVLNAYTEEYENNGL